MHQQSLLTNVPLRLLFSLASVGSGPSGFEGNIRFRKLIRDILAGVCKFDEWSGDYLDDSTPDFDQGSLLERNTYLATTIVETVFSRNGRFLEKSSTVGCSTSISLKTDLDSQRQHRVPNVYKEVETSVAIEKTKQSFRHQLRKIQEDYKNSTEVRDKMQPPSTGALSRKKQKRNEDSHSELLGRRTLTMLSPLSPPSKGTWRNEERRFENFSTSNNSRDSNIGTFHAASLQMRRQCLNKTFMPQTYPSLDRIGRSVLHPSLHQQVSSGGMIVRAVRGSPGMLLPTLNPFTNHSKRGDRIHHNHHPHPFDQHRLMARYPEQQEPQLENKVRRISRQTTTRMLPIIQASNHSHQPSSSVLVETLVLQQARRDVLRMDRLESERRQRVSSTYGRDSTFGSS